MSKYFNYLAFRASFIRAIIQYFTIYLMPAHCTHGIFGFNKNIRAYLIIIRYYKSESFRRFIKCTYNTIKCMFGNFKYLCFFSLTKRLRFYHLDGYPVTMHCTIAMLIRHKKVFCFILNCNKSVTMCGRRKNAAYYFIFPDYIFAALSKRNFTI